MTVHYPPPYTRRKSRKRLKRYLTYDKCLAYATIFLFLGFLIWVTILEILDRI